MNLLGISTLQLLLYMLFFALTGHRLLGIHTFICLSSVHLLHNNMNLYNNIGIFFDSTHTSILLLDRCDGINRPTQEAPSTVRLWRGHV